MSVLDLVRPDLRDFAGYQSARKARVTGDVWLNANESAWESDGEGAARLNRYPQPQPDTLRAGLARLYGARPEQLLVTRGSDEAIDLLVRALCPPGQGAIVVTPPTFGMYAVCARLHGVQLVEVPLQAREERFHCDVGQVEEAVRRSDARLVFLCSPGNPTGQALPIEDVRRLAAAVASRAVVVVDEAYQEFASGPSAVAMLAESGNVAVLRTLSKAHALAAARIGTVMADPALVEVLQRCQAPYPLAAPATDAALAALAPGVLEKTNARVLEVRGARDAMANALSRLPGVRQVHPSDANFLLVRFADAEAAWRALLEAGVVVRDMRGVAGLEDALRITVGTARENRRVMDALVAPCNGMRAVHA